MSGFEFVSPETLSEAIALLAGDDPTVRPFSGGTALMLMMKSGVFQPRVLVNLRGLHAELGRIEERGGSGLRIGALTTLAALESSPEICHRAPVISRAMTRLANVRVRNVARVGGAIAHGDPHMDLPPVLTALGATVNVVGQSGDRRVALEEFFVGYYETVLEPGELITSVDLPDQAGWSSIYLKTTTRSADDWPALGVAVSLRATDGVVEDCRLVVSAATEKATRLADAEGEIRGRTFDDRIFRLAADAAASEAETISDSRGSAGYKSQLLRVQLRRALEQATAQDQPQ
ncbi:Molybdopterin dehydrogenase FAD-binding [Agrobacterium deltaense Zutra 3/1]|uniref:Molybdopterin dehydrogenase FAD-binding n=1 Tax=Agrobacterium deltaense Zutra 3/1 TaxID=1183427 RepID=A0A1S7S2F2_9HYPH|nr:xanthine dehydrogenase family protein subunit M [Agrobacterium deltaense]CUX61625.1 Molybdopterin dehydrogenase FAD-binding [Agrobacterium deltaense Zutra 3/1]